MKKFHFLALAAAGSLMLASCSSDEVISSQQKPSQAIEFKAMANKATRAGVNTTNFDRFRIYGCNMDAGTSDNHVASFNFTNVTKNDAGIWSYQNLQYWAPNKDYYFVALSTNTTNRAWSFTVPDTHDTALTTADFKGYGTVNMNITNVLPNGDTADADQDLVYSYATRTTDADITNSTKVDLTFHHMLSRVGFTFENAFTNTNYTIQISDVKVGGLINEANCTLGVEPANLVWMPVAGEMASVSVLIPEGSVATKDTPIRTTEDYLYIIPGSQELSIQFNVTLLLLGQTYSVRTLNGTIKATDYKPGVSYMLTAKVSQDNIIEGGAKPIEFNVVAVDGWGTSEAGDVEFPSGNN